MGSLPLEGIRVVEYSTGIAGRLAGLLLADQGATVVTDRPDARGEPLDAYLDRGKLRNAKAQDLRSEEADIVIWEGVQEDPSKRPDAQIWLAFPAVLPGDTEYPFDDSVSEDILKAIVGFYTELAVVRKLIGEEIAYTSLPLCSVYAAVLGATAVGAALVDRTRHGFGRSIVVSKMAAGLSAIGAFTMEAYGLPSHLAPDDILKVPSAEQAEQLHKAQQDDTYFEWLKKRLNPFFSCYKASDGRFIAPIVSAHGHMTRRFLEELGVWEEMEAAGLLELPVWDPANEPYVDHNIAYPPKLNLQMRLKAADLIEAAVAKHPAAYWEEHLSKAGVVCSVVRDFDDWRTSRQALESGLSVYIEGCDWPQLGRSARVQSAKPYPKLHLAKEKPEGLMAREAVSAQASGKRPANDQPPLAGFRVLGLSNVIAGPACELLLAELGAEILKVDSVRPQHVPQLSTVWTGETAQGKKSILLDLSTEKGCEIVHKMAQAVDLVVSNKLDPVLQKIGLDREGLAKLNPKAIGVQVTGWKGELACDHDDYPGYDPVLQASTGIMTRFGSPDAPELHGVASAVDYLTGYLAAFAAVVALAARERRGDGKGDWADSSLESAASLVQLPYQVDPAPVGTAECLRQAKDGWICVDPGSAVLPDLSGLSTAEAIQTAKDQGVLAVAVQSAGQLKERHRDAPCETIVFRKEQGTFPVLVLRPTWLQFDGELLPLMRQAPLPGGDAHALLAEFGYGAEEIEQCIQDGIVGKVLWAK